jgi:predicted house-cleaning NTP pyrophosphatase (Maf/HAM1 superfamily)
MTTIMQWVLASSSPRRQELLKLLIPDFEVVPSDVDESVHAPNGQKRWLPGWLAKRRWQFRDNVHQLALSVRIPW